jgi:hypothetical protein
LFQGCQLPEAFQLHYSDLDKKANLAQQEIEKHVLYYRSMSLSPQARNSE